QLLNPIDLNNSYFNRDVNSTDNIEKIWNFAFDINTSQDIKNFDIGIKLSKSTGAIGTILLQNNSISNHIVNGPTSMKVYFKSSDGTKSASKTYDGVRVNVIDNVVVLYNNKLMINLANVMLSNDWKEYKVKFTAQNSYDMNITINNGFDINGSKAISNNIYLPIGGGIFTFNNQNRVISAKINIK
ncbi:MAG: hypothetical protein KAJ49_05195, partial [Arcobacteraceae bacterium]|nr:hypothetical protein [Arcobacteraceae bacterium]